MSLYRDQGIVLRTWKLAETDRIINVLTRGHGKVRCVAKGVRRPNSKFGARLEPTGHVQLQLYEGRNLDTITQVESIDQFDVFRIDLERFSKASAILEVADHVAQEGEPVPALYQLVIGALRALADEDSALLLPGFFLKILALEGVRPVLDACVGCGESEDLVAFNAVDGGVLCRTCRRGAPVSDDALDLMRLILGGHLRLALTVPASPTTHEVERLATEALEGLLERKLKSTNVLHQS